MPCKKPGRLRTPKISARILQVAGQIAAVFPFPSFLFSSSLHYMHKRGTPGELEHVAVRDYRTHHGLSKTHDGGG